jgi:hypothetical protein
VKRLAALLAAVGMIAGAVLVRGWLDDRRGSGGDRATGASVQLTLVCVTELAGVCEQLASREPGLRVRTEELTTTVSTLTGGDLDARSSEIDGWLTLAPLPEVVDEQRVRAGLQPVLTGQVGPLARSPLVLVVWNDRRAALEATCPDRVISWRCLGAIAGEPWTQHGGTVTWGAVKPGHPAPDRSAVGWLALAGAAASWFGRADYAANDFADPAFRQWLEKLERGVPSFPAPPRTPVDEMLSKGPGTFDVAASTEAAATGAIARSRVKDRLSVIYPVPSSTADVVLATVAGSDGEDRLRRLLESRDAAEVLADQGWRVAGREDAAGGTAEPLPPTNGLPRPGVLQALRNLWFEVIR